MKTFSFKISFQTEFSCLNISYNSKKKKKKKKALKSCAFFFTIVVFFSLVTLTAVKSSTKIKLRVHSGDNQTSYQKAFILVYNILIVNNLTAQRNAHWTFSAVTRTIDSRELCSFWKYWNDLSKEVIHIYTVCWRKMLYLNSFHLSSSQHY